MGHFLGVGGRLVRLGLGQHCDENYWADPAGSRGVHICKCSANRKTAFKGRGENDDESNYMLTTEAQSNCKCQEFQYCNLYLFICTNLYKYDNWQHQSKQYKNP